MATATIVADYEACIYGGLAAFATSRSTSTGFTTAPSSLGVGQYSGMMEYLTYRMFYRFDTSSLSGGTITQVNLRLSLATDNSDGADFDVQIVKADWSSYYPIAAGNRESAYDLALSAAADSNIWQNTADISTDTAYESGDLSTAWVNTSGYTYYALRSHLDYIGSSPGAMFDNRWVRSNSFTHATEGYRPALIVEYTEGGGGSSAPIHRIRTGMQPGMRIGL